MFIKSPISFFKKNNSRNDSKNKKFSANLGSKLVDISDNISNLINKEISDIAQKTKDLKKTNHDLALKHLKKGNISEASFRFWIMTKFWPDYYDAYYERAYCLYIENKISKSRKVLEVLLKKNSHLQQKAQELMDKLDSLEEKKL